MKKTIKIFLVYLIFWIQLPLFCKSDFEIAYEKMSTNPASEFDLKILQFCFKLQELNNLIIENIVRNKVFPLFSDSSDCSSHYYNYSYYNSIVQGSIICYNDDDNRHGNVICELTLNLEDLQYDLEELKFDMCKGLLKLKRKLAIYIYEWILNQAKSCIHPSFDESHLKVIIKEKTINNSTDNSTKDFVIRIKGSEEDNLWVVWKNGYPHFHDAFFE